MKEGTKKLIVEVEASLKDLFMSQIKDENSVAREVIKGLLVAYLKRKGKEWIEKV